MLIIILCIINVTCCIVALVMNAICRRELKELEKRMF